MTKNWIAGDVKTRLGASVGMSAAARIHKRFLFHLLGTLKDSASGLQIVVSPPGDVDVVMDAVTSAMADAAGPRWCGVPQSGGDLGNRMRAWFASQWQPQTRELAPTRELARNRSRRRVILVGADCPSLTSATIQTMFDRLDDHDVALIPASDGGYVAIGLASNDWNPSFESLFESIRWSTPAVYQQTMAAAERLGLRVATLPTHTDIDTVDDLWNWHRTHPLTLTPTIDSELMNSLTPPHRDIAIVGGGIIGLSIAWECLRRGHRVAIVEKGEVGRATSWAAAGILPPANFDRATDPLDRLRGFSHALWPVWAKQLSQSTDIDVQLHRCGGWYLAGSAGEAAAMTGMVAYWDDLNIACDRRTITELTTAVPELSEWARSNPWMRSHPESAAWFVADEYQIRPPRVLAALRQACLNLGATLIEHTAVSALEGNQLRDASGRTILTAERIVTSGGALTGSIEPRHRLGQALIPIRGQILLLHHPSLTTRNVLNVGNRYLLMRGDGHVLVGSCEEEVGMTPGTTDEMMAGLRSFASTLLPILRDATEQSRWSGHRPLTFDGFPMIGPMPLQEGLFVAAGHYRSGIHLAPGTAVAIADCLDGKSTFMNLDAFAVSHQQHSEV